MHSALMFSSVSSILLFLYSFFFIFINICWFIINNSFFY